MFNQIFHQVKWIQNGSENWTRLRDEHPKKFLTSTVLRSSFIGYDFYLTSFWAAPAVTRYLPRCHSFNIYPAAEAVNVITSCQRCHAIFHAWSLPPPQHWPIPCYCVWTEPQHIVARVHQRSLSESINDVVTSAPHHARLHWARLSQCRSEKSVLFTA